MDIVINYLDKYINIPPDTFIFDIETTGLSPRFCKVVLIGVLYNQDDKTILKQFFCNTEDEEKELLLEFKNFASSFSRHITFNGLSFDIPFLNARYSKYDLDFLLNKDDDTDILKLVKPYKEKLSLSDCKLKTIEKYMGIDRLDTISGKESVELYKEFVKNGSNSLKEKILLHNYEDIYYLGFLTKFKEKVANELSFLEVYSSNNLIKLLPKSYRFSSNKISVKYLVFSGNLGPLTIYNDTYTISSTCDLLNLDILIDTSFDSKGNKISYYNLSKVIPLKVNSSYLEKNIYTLSDYLLRKEFGNK